MDKDLLEINDLMTLVDAAVLDAENLEAEFSKYRSSENIEQQSNDIINNPQLSSIDTQNLESHAKQQSPIFTNHENVANNLQSANTVPEISKSLVVQTETNSNNNSKKRKQIVNVEEELQCSICREMFVKAVTLSCSHTYCEYCIEQWQKQNADCPICRARTTSSCRTLVLDSFIEKVMYIYLSHVQHFI